MEMCDGFEAAAEAVERVRCLLLHYGDTSTAPRLVSLEDRLRAGDQTAVVAVISEVTGGMGSLADRFLCPENSDKIASGDAGVVNQRLTTLIKELEVTARAVASDRGIRLLR